MLSLKEQYKKEILPELKKKFNIKNDLRAPRFIKVVVNIGIGKTKEDPKLATEALKTLTVITGQKPSTRLAKKAISGFKLRQGDKVGLMVTLRGPRMYDFLEKLIRIVLPRIRDFRGLKKTSIDNQNNLNIGIKEQVVFGEIKPEKIEKMHGLQITVVTTAQSKAEAQEFLELAGFKFEK